MDIELNFRDLQQVDLAAEATTGGVGWSGSSSHQESLRRALDRSWQGEVDLLVGELLTGVVVACGAVDHAKPVPELWMLSVRESWQGLGVGTALIAALEQRIVERGGHVARLAVEHDNPRAEALYRRLGYRVVDRRLESWPTSTGAIYVTDCAVMDKPLGSEQGAFLRGDHVGPTVAPGL